MNKKAFLFLIVSMLILLNGVAYAQTSQPNSLVLKLGFNFVSFTAKPSITPADFKNVYYSSTVEEVYTYSAVSGSFLSVGEGTLTAFNLGRGYIIKAKAAQNIYLDGVSAATIGDIKLKAGFNLLGFSKVPETIKFTELMKKYSVIKGLYKWSAASGSFIQVIRNGSNDPELLDGVDPAITVGQSYFINVTSDTSLNYDGDTIKFEGGSVVTPGVKTLVELVLNKTSDTVLPGGNYDLKNLSVTAKYSDGTSTMIISPWVIASGGGSISNQVFTAASINETVTFTCTYHDDDGSAKSVNFTLTVGSGGTSNTGKTIVTKNGANVKLNDISIEIPANSVDFTSEITVAPVNSYSVIKPGPGQSFFTCSSTGNVYNLYIKIPVKSGTLQNDVALTIVLPHLNKTMSLTPVINNTECVFFLGSTAQAAPRTSKSPQYNIFDGAFTGKPVVAGNEIFIIYRNDGISQEGLKYSVSQTNRKVLDWPYYKQYHGTCFATTWLMLMKGYGFPIDAQFDSIFDIVAEMQRLGRRFDKYRGLGNNVSGSDDKDELLEAAGEEKVEELTLEHNKLPINAYYCENLNSLINLIPTIVSQGRALRVDSPQHSVIICGYEIDPAKCSAINNKDSMYFWINDPASDIPLQKITGTEIENKLSIIAHPNYVFSYICYTSFSQEQFSNNQQTIHLSDSEGINDGGVKLIDATEKVISFSKWDPSMTGNGPNMIGYVSQDGDPQTFKDIHLVNIPIYNVGNDKKVAVKACIYKADNVTPVTAEYLCKEAAGSEYFKIIKTINSKPTYNFLNNEALVSEFLKKRAENNITDSKFILKVELMELTDDNKINGRLDGFSIIIAVPKTQKRLLIVPDKASIKINQIQKFQVLCDGVDVSKAISWTVPKGIVELDRDADRQLRITADTSGPYILTAKFPCRTYSAATGTYIYFHDLTEDLFSSVIITVTEGDGGNLLLNVFPETAVLYADNTLKFTGSASTGGIDWLIQELAEGGTITADGTYKAPPNNNLYYSEDSKYHVIAQSQVNSAVKKVIEVTVVRPQLEENIKTSEYDLTASGYFNVMYSAIKLRNIHTGAKDLIYYHGPYKKYYDNYTKLNAEGFHEKGKKTNVWTYYDSTGNKTETRTYNNDMLNGLKTKYWANGKKQEETNYMNDVPEGLYTYYNNNDSNSIYSQGNFAVFDGPNGRYNYKIGIWKTYYNELYTTICAYITEQPYINGYETGTEKSYYPNGNKRYEQEYLNGKKDGLFKSYADNNKLAEESHFKNDLYDGLYKKYDYANTGAVISEGNYIQGKREGIWISRDYLGVIYEYTEYKNDVWVNTTYPHSSMPYREIEWNYPTP
jgi:antitoxin component YwqK of YwqJK toxin-antitoxin module